MVWQRAGTVAVQNGSTTVVGTSVDFAASSRNGDSFVGPDGATYEVANVASSTVISILPAYKGPTVTGAAYAIMPVQGYDKMLSDAFNSLNNQFGPKLAALGTTGNYEILPIEKGGTGAVNQADARSALGLGAVATENILTVAKGGTGNSTGTAQKLASAAMVGTVSQSSGSPTGAIIEHGSNANGEYTKFADGTMICYRMGIPAAATANTMLVISFTFPSGFSATPLALGTLIGPTSNDNINISRFSAASGTPSSGYIQLKADLTQTYLVGYAAIGRWY